MLAFQVDKLKAYNLMVGQMSINSEELIKRETPRYETEVRGDVLKLIIAYRNTHREASIGLRYMDLDDAEESFAKFSMVDLSYDDYESMFDSHIRNMESLGGTRISEQSLVSKFIKKLDGSRYDHLQSSLREGVMLGNNLYPKSYDEAKKLVSVFKGSSTTAMKRSNLFMNKETIIEDDGSTENLNNNLCRAFAKYGKCLRDNCKYKHVKPGDIQTTLERTGNGYSNKNICYDFVEGKCDRGSKCRFRHDTSEIVCNLCDSKGHDINKCPKLREAKRCVKDEDVNQSMFIQDVTTDCNSRMF
jgi:hypothetical protein